jgi:hypothetical protein
MTSAASIIDALNARTAPPGRLREAARASWGQWLDRLGQRPGRVTGAPAQALVDQLAARPLASPPRRAQSLTRWQAFATLWRQQWHPAARDERGWRWTAGGTSFFWHVVLIVVLAWVTAVHFVLPRKDAAEDAVQVEFIGVGTPRDEGGGEPPAPGETAQAPSAATAAAGAVATPAPPAPVASDAGLPVPDIEAPVPDVATREVPEPTPAAQPLAVTTPVSPEAPVFELPPTTPPSAPDVAADLARVPPVREVDVPEPVRAPAAQMAAPRLAVDPLRLPEPAVVVREVPSPVRLPAPRAPSTPLPTATVRATTPDVARRDVPAPRAAEPVAAAPAPGTASAQPSRQSSERAAAPGPQVAPANPGVGAGPRPAPAPGSWATPRRADDWGESSRNRPGRGDGIRDSEGRPRIAAAPGSASPGRPPGTVTQEIADLDRAGTWLRRKAMPYEPTRFDRFWRPNESLLEEWVRRGVRQVSIPVPGSSKRLVCGVSILQLGGGCWVEDPNLNEQPATARPPPDIPFKPHLQEGGGVTSPPTPPGLPAGSAAPDGAG